MVDPVPSGRQAVALWRALGTADRRRAWSAARIGAAPADVRQALAMAGYGQLWHRRLRWLFYLSPLLLVLAICGGTLASGSADWLDSSPATWPVLAGAAFGGILVLQLQRLRFRRLSAAGFLGLAAERAGALPPAPSPGPDFARSAGPLGDDEFTVPATAGPTIPAPATAGPTIPAPATAGPTIPAPRIEQSTPLPGAVGVTELRTRRRPIVVVLLVVTLAMLCAAGNLGSQIGAWRANRLAAGSLLLSLFGLLFLAAMLLLLLMLTWRALRNPVTARFAPEGWQLPSVGIGGPWTDVVAIEVRALTVTDNPYSSSTASALRAVVLRVPDPEPYLALVGPLTRWALRRTVKKYGSPIAITAGRPRAPMDVEELLATLARYTPAPARWT